MSLDTTSVVVGIDTLYPLSSRDWLRPLASTPSSHTIGSGRWHIPPLLMRLASAAGMSRWRRPPSRTRCTRCTTWPIRRSGQGPR
eukprot:2872908-Pyramimonas_sp.AAC.1